MLFILRAHKTDAERPYKAFASVLPAIYIIAATVICIVLLIYKTKTSLPGLAIVLTGIPVYMIWKDLSARKESGSQMAEADLPTETESEEEERSEEPVIPPEADTKKEEEQS